MLSQRRRSHLHPQRITRHYRTSGARGTNTTHPHSGVLTNTAARAGSRRHPTTPSQLHEITHSACASATRIRLIYTNRTVRETPRSPSVRWHSTGPSLTNKSGTQTARAARIHPTYTTTNDVCCCSSATTSPTYPASQDHLHPSNPVARPRGVSAVSLCRRCVSPVRVYTVQQTHLDTAYASA